MTWVEWIPLVTVTLWAASTTVRLVLLERRVRHLEWRK